MMGCKGWDGAVLQHVTAHEQIPFYRACYFFDVLILLHYLWYKFVQKVKCTYFITTGQSLLTEVTLIFKGNQT